VYQDRTFQKTAAFNEFWLFNISHLINCSTIFGSILVDENTQKKGKILCFLLCATYF
jgi:hypothetical protein